MVVSSLFAEDLTHAHQQTQVSLDLVSLGHEHLLPVRFAGHDIHPDIKRNCRWSSPGFQLNPGRY